MNIIHTLLIILVILTIIACFVVQPNSNETNTNSKKPMIRVAPSGQPVISPHGRTRIGIDIMTGKPILIL